MKIIKCKDYYKYVGKSLIYKGVFMYRNATDTSICYSLSSGLSCLFDNEREAAIAYDKIQLSKGKPPVNILKAK